VKSNPPKIGNLKEYKLQFDENKNWAEMTHNSQSTIKRHPEN
jgi:hypothetical protein